MQGFAVGGEWAGSALLAAEYAPAAARGRYGMFTQLGVGSGLVMSSLLFLIVNSTIGETSPAFMDWGWRLPFLFSAVLIVIALYVRLTVAETPVFTEQKARGTESTTPVVALVNSPAARGSARRGQHGGLLHIGLHGQRVPQLVTPIPMWDIRRELILLIGVLGGVVALLFTALSAVAVRQIRTTSHHHGCVRGGCAVVVHGDSVARHR